MKPMIPMTIRHVELDFARTLPCLILSEPGGEGRKVAIFIDYDFVDHIAEGLKADRPAPEGMVRAWLEAVATLGGELLDCEIDDFDGERFHATLNLRRHDGQTTRIRVSPGCALAVALYGSLPISVREDLISQARECKACGAHLDEILNDLDDDQIDGIRQAQAGSKYKM